ncbi:palmitoyltransferase ZDHHC20-B-like isoform X3 [Portunus trituberculatus]|uniref:palmitoyltransferase ZDHHC20-B-like isoform X3 n=1 Tax=Portunus trituberculatus TaxID=210409 RepID=UPI001E1CC202|nr:palmitoyltransferase ZDHHC20-B-like isoform X3 [Portunus trituberculatus]
MAPRFCGLGTPCSLCLRAAKWLPVLFIVIVVVWSYYAYVLQLNLFTITNIIEKCFYLIIYHFLLVMFLWAYWQTIFTDIGTVPKQFRLPPSELDRYEAGETDEARRCVLEGFTQKQNLPIYNRTVMGEIRYCERCVQIKPDRCHHCSVCGVCVLKLDHHCPWVNNCVSFTNYKFFVLFLGYALLYCLFIAATTLQYFILFWKSPSSSSSSSSSSSFSSSQNQLTVDGKFHILFVFFVSIMFAISLVSLFGYHVFLVLKNRSTLESFRAPIFRLNHAWVQDKDGFSLGACNNFIEVFGEDRRKWFLPLATSLGDGVTYPQRCIDEDQDGLLGPRHRWADDDDNEMAYTGYNNHHAQSLEEVVVQSNHTNPV